MIDRNCVASGTTFSSLVKKRTIGSAINGRESVWYAVVVSNATSALILYILYWTGIWKKRTIKIE